MNTLDHSLSLMNTYNPKSVDTTNDVRLREQTDKFEAFLIKQILDIGMQNNNELFPKDAGEKIYNSMYNDAISTKMSGGFGFSEMLFNFLKEQG